MKRLLTGAMKFGGKADVKGFLARMSNSIGRHKKGLGHEGTSEDDAKEMEVENMAQSFIGEEDLKNFNPGMGTANLQVLGESSDGALDIGFVWEESDGSEASQVSMVAIQALQMSLHKLLPGALTVNLAF